jgi:hypothetical protein
MEDLGQRVEMDMEKAYVPAARVEMGVRHEILREAGKPQPLLGRSGESDDNSGVLVTVALLAWLAAAGLSRREGSRTRLLAGWGMGLLSLAMLAGIVWLLVHEFEGFGPVWLRWCEGIGLGLIAPGILAWRPRGRRHPADVEATLASQALLALAFVLFRPVADGLNWLYGEHHSSHAVALTLLTNYRAGFWVDLIGLFLVASPLYFSEERLRPLYDALHLWRSRSSTPTPTSTSTGSMPTGTPSSTAPAPPGSSPS